MRITTIEQWPKHSHGYWVIEMIRKYLEQNGYDTEEMQNAWLNGAFSALGDVNSVEFVQKQVENGNAESYTDAWHDVLGLAKRMFE